MNRIRHLLQSGFIVIALLGLDKVVGLVRAQLIAAAFGTGPEYDAFTAANQLPELFVTLISGGALAAAFIPVYAAYLTDERQKTAVSLANTTLTLVLLVLGSVSAVGALIAPWLTRTLLVPGFTPAQQALTGQLMQIILLQTTLFGISGVLSSILNAHQHFALPALAPLALQAGYILGLYLFVPTMGIHGLAWGTVVGGLLHIAVQVPGLVRHRFRYWPALQWQLTGVREIVRLMGPRIVTLGTVQFADLFIIRLTSRLSEGSTSGYFSAYYLQQLPETLFGTAIAVVIFPTLAELFNAGDKEGLKKTAVSALRIIWTLTVPSAVALALLGRPAISLLLERGEFTAESTQLVYTALLFFSVRIVSEATLEIAARLFFAQHDTRTPMFIALLWLVINISCAYWLVGPLGVGGLALASTVAFTVQSAVLLYLNHQRLGGLDWRDLATSAGRILLAAAGMGGVMWGIGRFITSPLLFLPVAAAVGGLVYLLLHFLLGGREIPTLVALVRRHRRE